ncbi:hypothetical protein EA473_09725 [Natrarchaeobius chitinivorans]|uniref:Uncharacterized protein n=1 Tax=Natrarchaeobius chitinivorans TaxID=1679083 RepID=A0A3N6MHV0_NATCH|nr:hypothetical protein EA473_09725 [Natrarchaeobius chitinivorans]
MLEANEQRRRASLEEIAALRGGGTDRRRLETPSSSRENRERVSVSHLRASNGGRVADESRSRGSP